MIDYSLLLVIETSRGMSEQDVESIINKTMIGTGLENRKSLANNDIPGSPERTTFSDINQYQDKKNSNSKETTMYHNLTTKDNSEN